MSSIESTSSTRSNVSVRSRPSCRQPKAISSRTVGEKTWVSGSGRRTPPATGRTARTVRPRGRLRSRAGRRRGRCRPSAARDHRAPSAASTFRSRWPRAGLASRPGRRRSRRCQGRETVEVRVVEVAAHEDVVFARSAGACSCLPRPGVAPDARGRAYRPRATSPQTAPIATTSTTTPNTASRRPAANT